MTFAPEDRTIQALQDPSNWAPAMPLFEDVDECGCVKGKGHVCVSDWMYPEFWEKCRKARET